MNYKHHLRAFLLVTVILCSLCAFGQSQLEHVVARGETMGSIAVKYGVTEEKLKESNPFIDRLFYTGMNIIIPKPERQSTGNQPTVISSSSTGSQKKHVEQANSERSQVRANVIPGVLQTIATALGGAIGAMSYMPVSPMPSMPYLYQSTGFLMAPPNPADYITKLPTLETTNLWSNQYMQNEYNQPSNAYWNNYSVPLYEPSSSSNYHSTFDETHGLKDCVVCHGSGKCQACNGTGVVTNGGGFALEPYKCHCNNGVCDNCHGSGKEYGRLF